MPSPEPRYVLDCSKRSFEKLISVTTTGLRTARSKRSSIMVTKRELRLPRVLKDSSAYNSRAGISQEHDAYNHPRGLAKKTEEDVLDPARPSLRLQASWGNIAGASLVQSHSPAALNHYHFRVHRSSIPPTEPQFNVSPSPPQVSHWDTMVLEHIWNIADEVVGAHPHALSVRQRFQVKEGTSDDDRPHTLCLFPPVGELGGVRIFKKREPRDWVVERVPTVVLTPPSPHERRLARIRSAPKLRSGGLGEDGEDLLQRRGIRF